MYIANSNSQKVLDFLISLFCFILIVDPINIIFKLKDVAFVGIVFFLIIKNKMRIREMLLLLIAYAIITLTFVRGVVAGYSFDYEYTTACFKAFTPLLLLCWIKHIRILEKLTFPCICIGVICMVIVISMLFFPGIEKIVYAYALSHDKLIIMTRRFFLGLEFISVYYRTVPLVIIPCSICLYKALFENKSRKKNIFIFAILSLTLFFSGTRANIMSVIFISVVFITVKINKGVLGRIIIFILLFLIGFLFLFLLVKLLSENSEESNVVKFGHLSSYLNLFDSNWDILIFGQGVGSLFYSSGFNEFTVQTEWSYIELIRYFGLLGGSFFIILFFYPLYVIAINRKRLDYALPFGLGYLFYLLIAGTNPLLISSTGMLALLVAYSYAYSFITETRDGLCTNCV